ncbi:MAG: neutral/alkaline non-lysosomal ceramidase N-terminal domain-containing protein [Flavobacteriaceae bacterium]|nr:neutral/alkaline non-lysosomal ceramidase N-terminal domain-containing protein [Flavobacteriaceae bacterium]
MEKWIKIVLKIIAALVVIILVVLYASISKIDTTPYFETSYYKNTIANIEEADSIRTTEKGQLLAGFSRANITPIIKDGDPTKGEFNKVKLAGFGDGKIATGVHDSLFVKAIALEVNGQTVVMVSGDILMTPQSLVDGVTKKLEGKTNISRNQIFYGATHTHSSMGNSVPGIVGKNFGGEFQPKLIDWMSVQYATAILNAIADKKPAKLATGYINVPDLVRNRMIGETGRLNDKLSVVSIKQDSAKQAVIGIYAAHATTISSWNDEYSGDYPGYFQRKLESEGIVDMAMFYAGTCGSHTNSGVGDKFEKSEYIGEKLAAKASECLENLTYEDQMTLSLLTSDMEIPKLQMIYLADNLRLSPFVGNKLVPEKGQILLQGLQLNNFIWSTVPYEYSGEYAIDIKNALELKGYNSVFTSFNGQYLGYIVPAKYYYYDNYEARLMGWFGPSMGDYLTELNYTIANKLTNSKL